MSRSINDSFAGGSQRMFTKVNSIDKRFILHANKEICWQKFFSLHRKSHQNLSLLNFECAARISTPDPPKEPLYIKGRGCAPRISEMTLIKLLKVPESYLRVSGNNWCLPLKSTNLNTKNWKILKLKTHLSICSRGSSQIIKIVLVMLISGNLLSEKHPKSY